jgi:hypothetical protein
MKQILHILRKDTRRFWVEIVISMIVMFAFALMDTNDWKVFHDQRLRNLMQEFIGILVMLMVASWWLLVARVVHAETLVGDRQFWITRPYEWKKLLAAKALFLVACFGVPYLLVQLYLLAQAGFHPAAFLPGILSTVLMVGLVFLVTVWSVVAVTSTFARLVLMVLACFLVFVGFMFVAFGWQHGYTSANPYANLFLLPLLLVGCVLVITLQYATRRVWVARGLLIAVPVVLALSVAAYRRQALVDEAYPAPAAGASTVMTVTHTPSDHFPDKARTWEGEDYIDLPIRFSGVADGYAVITDDFRFTITAADGFEWTSPWQEGRERLLPGDHGAHASLMIKPELYEHFKAGPVTLRIEYAVSRYQADVVTKMAYPTEAAVPGLGICARQSWGLSGLQCRSALHQPGIAYVETTWTKGACSDTPETTAKAYSWFEPESSYATYRTPLWMDFRLTAVRTSFLWFRNVEEDDKPGQESSSRQICPGSPMTVTQFRLADRTRAELTLANFELPAKVVATD